MTPAEVLEKTGAEFMATGGTGTMGVTTAGLKIPQKPMNHKCVQLLLAFVAGIRLQAGKLLVMIPREALK